MLQAAALAGAALTPAALAPRAFAKMSPDDPFTLGIASGEPAPDGVVIWTRLAPRPFEPDGGMRPEAVPVRWEVAEDAGFSRVAGGGSWPVRRRGIRCMSRSMVCGPRGNIGTAS